MADIVVLRGGRHGIHWHLRRCSSVKKVTNCGRKLRPRDNAERTQIHSTRNEDVPTGKLISILILDGSKRGHETAATITKGLVVKVVNAHTLSTFAAAVQHDRPDIVILGKEHSHEERAAAAQLSRERNPDIRVLEF